MKDRFRQKLRIAYIYTSFVVIIYSMLAFKSIHNIYLFIVGVLVSITLFYMGTNKS